MKRPLKNKQAFTLVEIIVAFTVLVLVILASTNLLVAIIRNNTENENTVVAYGLAQEGLEALRNVRDSNWLLGADFQGFVGGKCLWAGGVCLPGSLGTKKSFALKMQEIEDLGVGPVGSDAIPNYAPWELKDVTPVLPGDSPALQDTQLYLVASSSGDAEWYQPCFSPCTADPSIFSRWIEVEPLAHGPETTKVQKYRVSAVVRWKEIGRDKEVRLTTELTNWKGGPL